MSATTTSADLAREAFRHDETWLRYVEAVGPIEAHTVLSQWRDDLKSQRAIKGAAVQAGEADHREHQKWLMNAAAFERHVKRRMADLNVGTPSSRTDEESRAWYRARTRRHVAIIDTLAMAIHNYLEDADLGEDVLESALDAVMDFGRAGGEMSLADAIEQGLIPHGKRSQS